MRPSWSWQDGLGWRSGDDERCRLRVEFGQHEFALQENTLPGDIAAEAQARREALTSAEPSLAAQFPYLIEVVDELGASGYDYAEQFERGLDMILDGIEQLRR